MSEPYIKIRDIELTEAQAMAVRVAINAFYMQVAEDNERREALGPVADGYRDRLLEVLKIMLSH